MPDQKNTSSSPNWADRFFGPLYGELYRRHLLEPERSRREADFAADLLGLRNQRVLDLAAGFGRHARRLASANDVVALDLNLGYLQTAMQGLRGAAGKRLFSVRSDMRALPFSPRSFDSVLFLFNSFGYFAAGAETKPVAPSPAPKQQVWKLPEIFYQRQLVPQDFGVQRLTGRPAPTGSSTPGQPAGQSSTPAPDPNLVVLHEIARVLRPGGQLLMEVPNPRPLIEAVRTDPRRHVISASYEIEEEYSYDPESRILRNRTRFKLGRREEDGEYALRLYDRTELAAALRECGLTPVKTYGDYQGSAFSASRSDSMIVHAKRKNR